MNKKEFMKEIRIYLEKAYIRLNPVEIEDIIRDYEEYFREGLAEGKSEEELVDSMGDPKKLVDEMVRNDIEDGKYTFEDFSSYFSNDEEVKESNKKRINPNKFAMGINGFIKKLVKITIAIAVFIFDISYFPAIILSGVGIIVGTLAILTVIPYSNEVFSYIGQNKLLLIFPIMFVIGAVILESMVLWFLLRLGIKLNKIFLNTEK